MAKSNDEIIAKLEQQIRANKDKMQNEFIDKIFNDLQFLSEIAIKKDYQPTEHEREVFGQIVRIVNGINQWF